MSAELEKLIGKNDAPIIPMLRASNLVYVYANLRNIVMKYDKDSQFNKGKKRVDFVQPELILTQKSEARTFQTTFLKHELRNADILKFVDLNRKYLKLDGSIQYDETESNTDTFYFENGINTLRSKFDADIVEFNDLEKDAELLYSIVVNRTEKRVTVVFRGTATTRDIIQDLKYTQKTPKPVQEFAPEASMHTGFSNYLFKRALVANERTQAKTKYEQIAKVLEEIFSYKKDGKDYTDYELFVTGHSLGGALAQIFAFTMAGTELGRRIVPGERPVTALTYASPQCGTHSYLEAFNKLEFENKLRHLRISNDGDVIPIGLSYLPCAAKFAQPGVNIHVYPDKKADVAHNQMLMFFFNPLNTTYLLTKHSPGDYKDNLLNEDRNIDILSKTVEELYEEYVFKKEFD